MSLIQSAKLGLGPYRREYGCERRRCYAAHALQHGEVADVFGEASY
ncbi:hypothetical protein ABIC76_004998 [Ralstonia sp. 1138]